MVDADLTGVSESISKLTKINSTVAKKIGHALTLSAGEVIAQATRLTPIETGELRARTFIDTPKSDDNGKHSVYFGYEKNGDMFPKTPEGTGNLYSVYVHERTELHHPVGQSKFLETAFNNFESEMLQYLALEVRKCFVK